MTNIIATADLHGVLPEIEPCDILIIAGDVCPDHPIGKSERYGLPNNGSDYQLGWLDESFRAWLTEVPAKHIVGIAGNHDFVFERMRTAVQELHLPWIYLEDEEVEIDGIRIWGTPWVPGLPRWAFYGTERMLEILTDEIPTDLDIIVSHGPPYGLADEVGPRFGGPKNVGNVHLQRSIERLRPRAIVCGHIHEAFGVYEYGSTKIYNVSHNDDLYRPVNEPVLLEEFV